MTVSIIIPTYNRPALLQRAVASALAACPQDGEVIVVDDRSDTAIKALRDVTDPRLRITTNTGDKGAAGARNHGIAQAKGDIVMFLDDDDVMVADYPGWVLAAAAGSEADWGFSAQHAVDGDAVASFNPSGAAGRLFPQNAPLQRQIAAFSAGFWVRRHVFVRLDGVVPDQVNDEDTDFCCRLVAGGYRAWFEPEAGCIVYRGYATDEYTAPQLTRVFDPVVASQCYARTFQRNEGAFRDKPAARWFLLFRALRACARNQADDVARDLLAGIRPGVFRVKGYCYWQIKRLGRRLGYP